MDYPILPSHSMKVKWFQGFHYLDLIPYSIALLMMTGSVYIVVMAIEITEHHLR